MHRLLPRRPAAAGGPPRRRRRMGGRPQQGLPRRPGRHPAGRPADGPGRAQPGRAHAVPGKAFGLSYACLMCLLIACSCDKDRRSLEGRTPFQSRLLLFASVGQVIGNLRYLSEGLPSSWHLCVNSYALNRGLTTACHRRRCGFLASSCTFKKSMRPSLPLRLCASGCGRYCGPRGCERRATGSAAGAGRPATG